ncbi:MAG: lysophospholipid acyltransferase family protein [bacterium]|nr:lysophospholipid acyltransferase family protein [bacterium]
MKKTNFVYQLFRILGTPLFKLWYNPKIINKEVIPKKGGFIVCGNHLHFLDQFPVIISTRRTIHWLSKKEYFEGKHSWFYKSVGCISVDRDAHDGKARIKALKYLKEGEAIGIFPEGTRNKTNKELLKFKKGAVRMAQETSAPIIPFARIGKFKFRSKDLVLVFGNPIYVEKKDDIEEANNRLKNEILRLLKKCKKV